MITPYDPKTGPEYTYVTFKKLYLIKVGDLFCITLSKITGIFHLCYYFYYYMVQKIVMSTNYLFIRPALTTYHIFSIIVYKLLKYCRRSLLYFAVQ